MLESVKSYATISVTTDKYKSYKDINGKTKLSHDEDSKEKLTFMFDRDGLENIVFRDKGNSLHIDDKIMYFNIEKGKLLYIYFKSKDTVWMIKDPKPFMDDCKKAYTYLSTIDTIVNCNQEDYMTGFYNESELPDEFEFDD